MPSSGLSLPLVLPDRLPTAVPLCDDPLPARQGATERMLKRALDVAVALPCVLALLLLVPLVWLLNQRLNRGPVFFSQVRMGRGGVPFTIVKLRTMVPAGSTPPRGFDEPLETQRITPFGAFLRRTHLDELPQALNILRGEMSLVGPRPDIYEHALAYLTRINGYRERLAVRPGLTGLAQVRCGYAEGVAETRRKVCADRAYIRRTRRAGVRLDLLILALTARKAILRA